MTEGEIKLFLERLRNDLDDLAQRVSRLESDSSIASTGTKPSQIGGFLSGLESLLQQSGYPESVKSENEKKAGDQAYYQFPAELHRVTVKRADPLFSGRLADVMVFEVSVTPLILRKDAVAVEGHFTFQGPSGEPTLSTSYIINTRLIPNKRKSLHDVTDLLYDTVEQQWFLRSGPSKVSASFHIHRILYADNSIELNESYVPASFL